MGKFEVMSSIDAPAAGGGRTPVPGDRAPKPRDRAVSIVLNGKPRSVSAGLTVAALLRDLALRAGMVVVERNRNILSRHGLEAVPVEEGDRIEIVHFVGGG